MGLLSPFQFKLPQLRVSAVLPAGALSPMKCEGGMTCTSHTDHSVALNSPLWPTALLLFGGLGGLPAQPQLCLLRHRRASIWNSRVSVSADRSSVPLRLPGVLASGQHGAASTLGRLLTTQATRGGKGEENWAVWRETAWMTAILTRSRGTWCGKLGFSQFCVQCRWCLSSFFSMWCPVFPALFIVGTVLPLGESLAPLS